MKHNLVREAEHDLFKLHFLLERLRLINRTFLLIHYGFNVKLIKYNLITIKKDIK